MSRKRIKEITRELFAMTNASQETVEDLIKATDELGDHELCETLFVAAVAVMQEMVGHGAAIIGVQRSLTSLVRLSLENTVPCPCPKCSAERVTSKEVS